MQRSQTYRWAARLGGFALTLAFAFPMVFSEVEPAEAQSPVCFTIHGKCFCVDFFLTEVRDMAWGKVQDEIASLYDDFFTQQLDTQVRDVLALIRHPEELLDWRSYGSQVQTVLSDRAVYNAGITAEDLQTNRSLLNANPHISEYLASNPAHTAANTVRPMVESIAFAMAAPESLLPYATGDINDSNRSLSDGDIVLSKAWADRMIIPPDMEVIPGADSIANMSSNALSRQYLTARVHAIGKVAQQALLAPVTQDAEIAGINSQLSQVKAIQGSALGSVADMQSATILADALESEALLRRVESHLRQERLLGSLIVLKQEQAMVDLQPGEQP